MCIALTKIAAARLSDGVLPSTLTPFDEYGSVLTDSITDQASRLAQINGVTGIVVNTMIRERETLTTSELLDVIKRTRAGLSSDQLLLTSISDLSDTVIEDVEACQAAGANAIITFPAEWQKSYDGVTLNERIDALAALAARLPLPVIVVLGNGEENRSAISDEVMTHAQHTQKVIGFDMGAYDNVLRFDLRAHASKATDQPLAGQPSSEGARFHTLKTDADGMLSYIAYVAPHEIVALFRASRAGRSYDAQALYNRLSPLIALLSDHDLKTRELICREVAHHRGLLASTATRGIADPLCPELKRHIHRVINGIGLRPISWV